MIDKDIKAYIDAEIEKVRYKNDALQSSSLGWWGRHYADVQEEYRKTFHRIERQRTWMWCLFFASIIIGIVF